VKLKLGFLGLALLVALALVPVALAEADEVPGDIGFVVLGSKTGNGAGIVRIRSDETGNDGIYEHAAPAFFPYPGSAVGDGVRVAVGDFNGDGNSELVTAAGTGVPVKIWALNPDGTIGDLIDSKRVFGSRGVFVAAGDFNNDGLDELITAAASGSPNVKVWHDSDADLKVFDSPGAVESFLAYPSGFHGGVRVASDNVTNSGGEDLVTAQGPGGRQVKIWTDTDGDARVSDLVDNPIFDQFNAYPSSFNGGVFVAAGQMSGVGGGGAEVIVAPGAGTQKLKIYTDSNASGKVSDNPVFESFFPYGSSWNKGVRPGAGDTDHSGFLVEVLTAPGASAGSKPVKIYDDDRPVPDANAFISDNALGDSFSGGAGNAGVFPAFGEFVEASYAAVNLPVGLVDGGTRTNDLIVPASAGKIVDLDIALSIQHTWNDDLDITLTHMSTGTSLTLWTDCGSSDDGFIVVLTDEAGTDICAATAPTAGAAITGTYHPEGVAALSAFDTEDASGRWRLTITDDTLPDTGTLFAWSLHVTY
jgi:hypothetical protein